MVFEHATEFPTTEEHLAALPAAALGVRLVEARRRGLLPRRARRVRRSRSRSAGRSTPTGRARCRRPSRASPTRCRTCSRKSLARLRPLPIFGSGEQTRTLTHIDDIADGIVTAMGHPGRAERGLQHLGRRGAHRRRDRADLLGGGRQRPGRARARAPAELRGRRAAPLAVGGEGRAAAGLARAHRRPRRHRGDGGVAARALITGITGQDGSYLAELLLEKGYEVHGMVRRSSTEKFERIEHLRDRITLHQGDLLDQRSLVDALRAARPDEVYNLAAMSFVAVSWIQPTLTAEFTGVGRHAHARGAARGRAPRRASTRRPRARCSARCARRRRPRRRRSTRARRTAWRRPTATTSRSTTASRTASSRAPGSSSTTSARAAGSSS